MKAIENYIVLVWFSSIIEVNEKPYQKFGLSILSKLIQFAYVSDINFSFLRFLIPFM